MDVLFVRDSDAADSESDEGTVEGTILQIDGK